MLLVADKAEIERVVLRGKNTEQLKRTNDIFSTIIPTSLISLPTNDTWKRHRRLTGPSMSRRYLGRMSIRMLAEAKNLVRLWTQKATLGRGAAFDADIDLQMSTLLRTVNITIGRSPQCLGSAFTASLVTAPTPNSSRGIVDFSISESSSLHSIMRVMMQGIERVSSAAFPALTARLFLWTSPTWRNSYTVFTAFFKEEIDRARAREEEIPEVTGNTLATDADCVLDMLLQREKREGAEKLSERELLDELLTYVIAGQDSTASALAWLVKFLASDAEVQRQLHEEMTAVLGPDLSHDAELDYNALDSAERVPVLEAVVAETLRCANVGSLTGRERKYVCYNLLAFAYLCDDASDK
ncbi:cytochrome P450 family protein [Ceratobasidium sp. AG-Ba]|nr:cytochrome P450 family protein [Ceratobasidium sp. AG-Ba]